MQLCHSGHPVAISFWCCIYVETTSLARREIKAKHIETHNWVKASVPHGAQEIIVAEVLFAAVRTMEALVGRHWQALSLSASRRKSRGQQFPTEQQEGRKAWDGGR